jgi:hypothetical protein
MGRKAELKDQVRELMDQNPIVTYGPNALILSGCVHTGKLQGEPSGRTGGGMKTFAVGMRPAVPTMGS